MGWWLALFLVPILVAGAVFLLLLAPQLEGGSCTAPICGPLQVTFPIALGGVL